MGLESATYVDDLNSAWPLGSDNRSAGDDHLRLIKAVLLASRGTQALAEAGTDTVSRLWSALELAQAIAALETNPDLSGYAVKADYADTHASVYMSSNASLTQNTWTKISFNAELYDVGDNFSGGTYTVPSDGKYLVCAAARFAVLNDGNPWQLAIYLNGSQAKQIGEGNVSGSTNEAQPAGAAILDCSTSDTIDLYGYVETTGDYAAAGAGATWMTIARIV